MPLNKSLFLSDINILTHKMKGIFLEHTGLHFIDLIQIGDTKCIAPIMQRQKLTLPVKSLTSQTAGREKEVEVRGREGRRRERERRERLLTYSAFWKTWSFSSFL